uniref:CSON000461 protein n=1 Tax=Culicoides sonorensis TaxID=179676 RepID=A0A336LPV1_CULSO
MMPNSKLQSSVEYLLILEIVMTNITVFSTTKVERSVSEKSLMVTEKIVETDLITNKKKQR